MYKPDSNNEQRGKEDWREFGTGIRFECFEIDSNIEGRARLRRMRDREFQGVEGGEVAYVERFGLY
jgi:hypothetical protein